MAPNKKRNAGRQLLIVKNRLRLASDPSEIASLRRQEAVLHLELGSPDNAVAIAASLAEGNEPSGSDLAFLADMLASAGKWTRAEKVFLLAAGACRVHGRADKADSLLAGPVFILAEARNDFSTCLEHAPFTVLRNRALRQMGEENEASDVPQRSPWRELHILEMALRHRDPSLLTGILDDWKCGEAEWRWRILYEGAMLESSFRRPSRSWRKYLEETGNRVLDPRYLNERSTLKGVLR